MRINLHMKSFWGARSGQLGILTSGRGQSDCTSESRARLIHQHSILWHIAASLPSDVSGGRVWQLAEARTNCCCWLACVKRRGSCTIWAPVIVGSKQSASGIFSNTWAWRGRSSELAVRSWRTVEAWRAENWHSAKKLCGRDTFLFTAFASLLALLKHVRQEPDTVEIFWWIHKAQFIRS